MLDDGAEASVLDREDCLCAAVAKLRMSQLWVSPSEGLIAKWCYSPCSIPDLVASYAFGSWEYAEWSCTSLSSKKQSLTGSPLATVQAKVKRQLWLLFNIFLNGGENAPHHNLLSNKKMIIFMSFSRNVWQMRFKGLMHKGNVNVNL